MEPLYQELKLWEDKSRPLSQEERLDAAAASLCVWYEKNKRDLPWRQNRDPYHIWISEIMLQQTRTEAVRPYFTRFLEVLPDVTALAQAPDELLLKLWEGLGYYSRARNLKKAAQICAEYYGGQLPDNFERLLELPGIGSYTAGAIASIAFGEAKPAVDGNVLRVIHRLLACRDDISSQKVKKVLEGRLEASMLRTGADPGTYNQALMELGACICIPNGEPLCKGCPLSGICLAAMRGETAEIPYRQPKKPRRMEERTVFVITDGERFVLGRRPKAGLLAGLYELPGEAGHMSREEAARLWERRLHVPVQAEAAGDGKHVFSHVEWHMTGWMIRLPERLEIYRNSLEKMGYLLATGKEIRETYAVPGAFSCWRKYWEEEESAAEAAAGKDADDMAGETAGKDADSAAGSRRGNC